MTQTEQPKGETFREHTPFDPEYDTHDDVPSGTSSNGHKPKRAAERKRSPKKNIPLEFTDAYDILHADLPPRKWIVPDILPVGLTSLSAKGKIGKSFTLLEICIMIIKPEQGRILYLDLEGDDLLLQERMKDILQGRELERDHLCFTHEAPGLDNGLLGQIRQKLQQYGDVIMVVIDVYSIVQAAREGTDIYLSDSKAWSELHNFAHDNNIALVVLHHTNKRQNVEDPFDLISGSMGISGSCDCQWLLLRERGQMKAKLLVSGRAIRSDTTIEFNLGDFSGKYKVIQEKEDIEMNTSEQKALKILKASDIPLAPKKIAELTGLELAHTRKLMIRMKEKGLVKQTDYGLYSYRSIDLAVK